jgi:hypothetical protein
VNKISYSTFSDNLWTIYKKVYHKVTEQTFLDNWDKTAEAVAQTFYKETTPDYMADAFAQVRNCLLFAWKFRAIEHYFLAPGLRQFLISSVPSLTVDYCRKLPTSILRPSDYPEANNPVSLSKDPNFSKEETQLVQTPLIDWKKPRAFALHFPSKESTKSIVVWPDAYLWNDSESCHMLWFFAATDGADIVLAEPTSGDFGEATDLVKLVYGFSLYLEAFPETVVEAGAKNVHKLNYYRGEARVVECNQVASSDNESAAVSPHFRRGHFRVLHSERFTKKQGQVVFVKGCFVKGKAYEVLSDAPPVEQKEAA